MEMGCRMSPKIHFLHSHLDVFPDNFGAVSGEQGERFLKDFWILGTRYQGFWNENRMADHCWMLYRNNHGNTFKRKLHAQRLQIT